MIELPYGYHIAGGQTALKRGSARVQTKAHITELGRERKHDFPDAEPLVKRLVAQELTLSFVLDVARLWRTVTRRKVQRTGNQLRNRLECQLEEAHVRCRV
jgi:hypothetical protein